MSTPYNIEIAGGWGRKGESVCQPLPKDSQCTTSTGREMVVEMPVHRQATRHEASYLDLFLCSAADYYPGSLMVAVLSGAETGNFEGLRYVREHGARIVVQDPATCMMAESSAAIVATGLEAAIATPDTLVDHIRAWAGNARP